MKFLVVLGALMMQCTVTKSWNGDSYSAETFHVLGWVGYLKRSCLIALMFSAVVLYYIPQSRPHARRICYIMIDSVADGLKSVINASESEYLYQKIKSHCHRARYEQSTAMQKQLSRKLYQNEVDSEHLRKRRSNKSNYRIDEDGSPREQVKKMSDSRRNLGEKRDHRRRQSYHRHHDSGVKELCRDVQSVRLRPDRLQELQDYFKRKFSGIKELNDARMESYGFLISGNPRQMAILDQRYEKDDFVIFRDVCPKIECKECGTSMESLPLKPVRDTSSANEGPTDYHNYSPINSMYQNKHQHIDGRNAKSSPSSLEFNDNRRVRSSMSSGIKLPRKVESHTTYKKIENIIDKCHDEGENRVVIGPHKFSGDYNINLHAEDERNSMRANISQKREEAIRHNESVSKRIRKLRPKNSDTLTRFYCNDNVNIVDREGDADDENSQNGERRVLKYDLDDRPRRESRVPLKNSKDVMLLNYDYEAVPIIRNRARPTLLQVVKWIFSSCPEAGRKVKEKTEVGKEEIQGVGDEWLR